MMNTNFIPPLPSPRGGAEVAESIKKYNINYKNNNIDPISIGV